METEGKEVARQRLIDLQRELDAWRDVARGRRDLLRHYRFGTLDHAKDALRRIMDGADALRKLGINNP